MRSEPYTLPPCGEWQCAEDVAAWASACLVALLPPGWSFGWDRAVRRLGCCQFARRRITLSRYFVAAYLVKDAELVRRTVLHELAHALTMEHHRTTGHGRLWQYYCGLLGIAGERASCRCDDFAPSGRKRPIRYVLCHRETGEVFRRYRARPCMSTRRLAQCYIRGRREETFGMLIVRECAERQD
jgi:hypothetical protein